jgi:hypothetical protein
LALSLVPGCGPGVGDVSGKVFFKGKEVTSGFVTMVGQDGIPKNSNIAEDGSYRIAGLPVGEVKIVVRSPAVDPAKSNRPPPKREGVEAREEAGPMFTENQKKTWRELPIQYADITRTELRCTVNPGSNAHNIELK